MKRFETGVSVPKEKLINTICEKYHVNPVYFTGEIRIDEAITETAKDDRKNAGKRLKQIRLEMDMSLMEFSSLINISNSHLYMVETGNKPLREKMASDIADRLHVGVDWLLYRNERAKDYPVNAKMVDWLKEHPEKRLLIEGGWYSTKETRTVRKLMRNGMSDEEIATELDMSVRKVRVLKPYKGSRMYGVGTVSAQKTKECRRRKKENEQTE